jgi:hypothetical protein
MKNKMSNGKEWRWEEKKRKVMKNETGQEEIKVLAG